MTLQGPRVRHGLTLRSAANAGGDYSVDPHERYEAGGFPQVSTMLEASGERTMRRLAEPIQRAPGDSEPVSTAPKLGIDAVIAELDRQVSEGAAARAAEKAAEAQEGAMSGADLDAQFVQSILETDPHVVLRAVAEYLRGQSA